MNLAHYTTLRLHPYPWRSEHLNVGLVVLLADGSVRVHVADSLKKVRAFAPGVDLEAVRGWPAEMQQDLTGCRSLDEAAARLSRWGHARQLSEQRGMFRYANEHEYSERVGRALARLVEPERPMRKPADRSQRSRLEVELKTAFAAYGWMSADPSQVDHRIVHHYPIEPEMDLHADFAVRNGVMHVIETVDFRVADPASKRDSARAKALVLTLAKDARRYAIVAGGDGEAIRPAVRLLASQADALIRWERPDEVDGFLGKMAQITGIPMIGLQTT